MLLTIQAIHGQLAEHPGGGGLDPFDPASFGGILWTWLIFLFAVPVMWKFVMGPITKSMEARDEAAQRALAEAQRARDEVAQAKGEIDGKLAEARADAAKLLADARGRAATVEKQMLDEAQSKAQKLAEDAQKAILAERDKALVAIREEVVELSLAGAKAVLQRNVGGDDDRRLVADMVGKLKAAKK